MPDTFSSTAHRKRGGDAKSPPAQGFRQRAGICIICSRKIPQERYGNKRNPTVCSRACQEQLAHQRLRRYNIKSIKERRVASTKRCRICGKPAERTKHDRHKKGFCTEHNICSQCGKHGIAVHKDMLCWSCYIAPRNRMVRKEKLLKTLKNRLTAIEKVKELEQCQTPQR